MTEKDTFLPFLGIPFFAGRQWIEDFLKEGRFDEDVVRAQPEGRGAGQPVRSTRRAVSGIPRERPRYPEEDKW